MHVCNLGESPLSYSAYMYVILDSIPMQASGAEPRVPNGNSAINLTPMHMSIVIPRTRNKNMNIPSVGYGYR
jgi:hypothetical protein